MSFDFASLVNGPRAPDLAIFALLSSCVARLVMQPTALHCTSTFGDIICLIRGASPPSNTMATLFSALHSHISMLVSGMGGPHTVHCKITESSTCSALHLDIGALQQKKYWLKCFAINLTNICRT